MNRAILIYAIGLCLLICCLGASAQGILAADPIDESTGITLGIVTGAIFAVAVGAWKIARYTRDLEERIRELEERSERKQP